MSKPVSLGPHPQLLPFLEEFGVTYEAFRKTGRPTDHIVSVRSAVITRLHIEVKPAWVFRLEPTHRKTIRIALYRQVIADHGLELEFWTEEDKLHGYLKRVPW